MKTFIEVLSAQNILTQTLHLFCTIGDVFGPFYLKNRKISKKVINGIQEIFITVLGIKDLMLKIKYIFFI